MRAGLVGDCLPGLCQNCLLVGFLKIQCGFAGHCLRELFPTCLSGGFLELRAGLAIDYLTGLYPTCIFGKIPQNSGWASRRLLCTDLLRVPLYPNLAKSSFFKFRMLSPDYSEASIKLVLIFRADFKPSFPVGIDNCLVTTLLEGFFFALCNQIGPAHEYLPLKKSTTTLKQKYIYFFCFHNTLEAK